MHDRSQRFDPTLERRRERRVPVHLPDAGSRYGPHRGGFRGTYIQRKSLPRRRRIRDALSRSISAASLEINIPVLPTSASEPDAEFSTQGRIVHLDPRQRAISELIVGVEFTGPRFHRMFVSESTS